MRHPIALALPTVLSLAAASHASDDDLPEIADEVEELAVGVHVVCPKDMVAIGDACMDRYEAPNRRGARPLTMQSARDGEAFCGARGKRLCTEDEWVRACEGTQHRSLPYGMKHEDSRCNDDKVWRQVDELLLDRWPSAEAKAHAAGLYQATPSGQKAGCRSQEGVFDLTGNVEEWVARSRSHKNNHSHVLVGCYWSGCYGGGKPTCMASNSAHVPEWRFYETGFRCCRDGTRRRP